MPSIAAVPEAPAPVEALTLDAVAVVHGRKDAPPFEALRLDRLEVAPATALGVSGPSGAGKSTLLHLVAGLTTPTEGAITWGPTRIDRLGEGARDRWRRETVGFVFQDFHLVDELSVFDNVLLPARFAAFRAAPVLRARAEALIARVGLADPARRAGRLSRGERQRVAVARALLMTPRLILADEPTASLDAVNGHEIADLLVQTARESGATLIVAAHDRDLLDRMDRVVALRAGRRDEDTTP